MKATLEDAIVIAVEAHRGQKDKAGAAYITHPLRLTLQMETEPIERHLRILDHVVQDGDHLLDLGGHLQHQPEWMGDVGSPGLVLLAPVCLHGEDDGIL